MCGVGAAASSCSSVLVEAAEVAAAGAHLTAGASETHGSGLSVVGVPQALAADVTSAVRALLELSCVIVQPTSPGGLTKALAVTLVVGALAVASSAAVLTAPSRASLA